ncbi:MAG: hypothetical protein ABWU16_04555 [Halothiobacillaceae bacterium]
MLLQTMRCSVCSSASTALGQNIFEIRQMSLHTRARNLPFLEQGIEGAGIPVGIVGQVGGEMLL